MSIDHTQYLVTTQEAFIDEGILPVVKWLNSFTGIITKHSCQGDKERNPYVSFICDDVYQLLHVVSRVIGKHQHVAKCEVIAHNGMLRYVIRFKGVHGLQHFLKWLDNPSHHKYGVLEDIQQRG